MKEIDLNEQQQEAIPKKKTSLFQKLKARIKVWKSNLGKMPLSHKIVTFLISISLFGLVSIAFVYGFILTTTPAHQPLDTSYQLLKVQNKKQSNFNYQLPPPPQVRDQENPINGELYTQREFEEMLERKAFVAMIENSPDARPQAGLSDADLVYETLAESGITRYMAVFWGKESEKIGPIRSIRTYYLNWASGYDDPPVLNIGQAGYDGHEDVIVPEADARAYMNTYNTKSFDRYGRSVTWRDNDKYNSGIAWEHVAYSSSEKVWEDAEKMGWTGPSDIESLKFKKDADKEERQNSQEIQIEFLNLNSSTYRVKWVYDRDKNIYNRFLAGTEHIDENNGKQIKAKNIVILYYDYEPTGDKNGRILIDTIGEGEAKIIRDGKTIEGTWKKDSRTSRTHFYNLNDKEIALNRGTIWIEGVAVSGNTLLSNVVIE